MPGKKGAMGNSKKRGSRIVRRKRTSGPNKGKARKMRVYIGPDGKRHSAPA